MVNNCGICMIHSENEKKNACPSVFSLYEIATQRSVRSFSRFGSRELGWSFLVPVRSNRHNVMLFVPENAILLMLPLKLIVAAAVLRKSVTSLVASL